MKIPDQIIPEAYEISKNIYEGKMKFAQGQKHLSEKFTVNKNSVGDFINNFRYLIEGKEFQRTLNDKSMDYFLENISSPQSYSRGTLWIVSS